MKATSSTICDRWKQEQGISESSSDEDVTADQWNAYGKVILHKDGQIGHCPKGRTVNKPNIGTKRHGINCCTKTGRSRVIKTKQNGVRSGGAIRKMSEGSRKSTKAIDSIFSKYIFKSFY